MVSARAHARDDGWVCDVAVEHHGQSSHHAVTVTKADFERWSNGRDVEELVRRSFDFLLEPEPPASILRHFDLSVIQSYFPEYDREIRR